VQKDIGGMIAEAPHRRADPGPGRRRVVLSGAMTARDRTRIGVRSDRRSKLVDAAVGLVHVAGLSALDASAVADAAGVSKALVFYYFPSHLELQAAVVQGVADDLLDSLRSRAAEAALLPRAKVAAGLDEVIATIEADPATYTALARGAGGHPRLFDVYEATRTRIVAVMADGFDLPDPPLRAQLALRGWVAMVEEVVLHWIVNDRAVDRARLVDYLTDLCITAVERAADLDADPVP
jgi:AcrR family transcriptional regulator